MMGSFFQDAERIRSLTLPRHIVQQRLRPSSARIPSAAGERTRLAQAARHYVSEYNPVPPLPLEQLREHAGRMLELAGVDAKYVDYAGVLLNNELWREAVAAVPYEKRLLLLPKCLRNEAKCTGKFDEFGLLCRQCGLCSIQDLQQEAEALGYAVLVAEGSAMVTALIQTGKVEAIVGVSCLGVLEKAFPFMEAAAIPGLAIPLLQDDCRDTTVDLECVWDCIHVSRADQTRRLDLGALRDEVETWFEPSALDEVMGPAEGKSERLARSWLGRAGKRWRPFLTVAAFRAMRAAEEGLPAGLRKLAVAVECFHKASLIHDDIEDGDEVRYGERTLHAEFGVPVALNVGDLLIGEGYRLIGECECGVHSALLAVAAGGQRQLCRGQGAELCWAQSPTPLTQRQVLEIFRQKTAPAFEVALKLGVLFADGMRDGTRGEAKWDYETIAPAIRSYSEALGIAYQVRDDLADYDVAEPGNDLGAMRPGLLLAIGYERARGAEREQLEELWTRRTTPAQAASLQKWLVDLGAIERARAILEAYKEEAVRSLADVENPNLKGLLRRVIGRIFQGGEISGWCREVEQSKPGA